MSCEKAPPISEVAGKLWNSGDSQEVGETTSEMNKSFDDEFRTCAANYQKDRYSKGFDERSLFHVVILHKKERLMKNVVRRYFLGRETEPRPDYDQTVYQVDPISSKITFKWVIPDINTYQMMTRFPTLYPLDEQHLVQFCVAMQEDRLADYQKNKLII